MLRRFILVVHSLPYAYYLRERNQKPTQATLIYSSGSGNHSCLCSSKYRSPAMVAVFGNFRWALCVCERERERVQRTDKWKRKEGKGGSIIIL